MNDLPDARFERIEDCLSELGVQISWLLLQHNVPISIADKILAEGWMRRKREGRLAADRRLEAFRGALAHYESTGDYSVVDAFVEALKRGDFDRSP
jgi:hypothetical protein